MIVDAFARTDGFPFERYFEEADQFAAARRYWWTVLGAAAGFDGRDWSPRARPDDPAEDMYLGRVADIVSIRLRKEISLQTASVPGAVHMLLTENRGMTPGDALAEARALSVPLVAWVETGACWEPDPLHPEGGRLLDRERLILTAEISEAAEPMALRALALFLMPGPALHRVNAAFAPDEG